MSDRVTMPCTVPFERTSTAGFDFDSSFDDGVHRLAPRRRPGTARPSPGPPSRRAAWCRRGSSRRQRPVAHRTDAVRAVHHRQLRHVVQRHESQRLSHRRSRRHAHDRRRFAVVAPLSPTSPRRASCDPRRAAGSRASTRRCRASTDTARRCREAARRRAPSDRRRAARRAARHARSSPLEPPTNSPSSRVSRRAIENDSLSLTVMKSSINAHVERARNLVLADAFDLVRHALRAFPRPSFATSRRESIRPDRRRSPGSSDSFPSDSGRRR